METREASFKMLNDRGVKAFMAALAAPHRLRTLTLAAWPGVGDAALVAISQGGKLPGLQVGCPRSADVDVTGLIRPTDSMLGVDRRRRRQRQHLQPCPCAQGLLDRAQVQ